MRSRRDKSHVQGSVDGLCGVYALVHYIERIANFPVGRSKTRAKAGFQALLKSAENLKSPYDGKPLLSAERIATGYYTDDLVEMFNLTMSRKRLPHRAVLLEEICQNDNQTSIGQLIRSLIEDGAKIVLQVNAGTHFVLAHDLDEDGDILVRDSGHVEKFRVEELKKAPCSQDGVVIAKAGTIAFSRMR